MLTLFKESSGEAPLLPDPLNWARCQWRRQLDKGLVPSFSQLQEAWHKEYPHSPEGAALLMSWCEQLASPAWLDAGLSNEDVREIFAHGPELVEAVGSARQTIAFPLESMDWELW